MTLSDAASPSSSRFELARRGGERIKKYRAVEDWEIPSSLITYSSEIGHGSFGTVYKAQYFGLQYFGLLALMLSMILQGRSQSKS